MNGHETYDEILNLESEYTLDTVFDMLDELEWYIISNIYI